MRKSFIVLALVATSLFSFSTSEGAVRYSSGRPFNWYYPNNYRYYYPQLKVYGNACQLIYVNGTFVYTCP